MAREQTLKSKGDENTFTFVADVTFDDATNRLRVARRTIKFKDGRLSRIGDIAPKYIDLSKLVNAPKE